MTPPPWRSRSRRGLRLLGSAVRAQPWGFAGSLAGSTIYAAMSVAMAWLLGRLVDRLTGADGADVTPILGWLVVAAAAQALGFAVREICSAVMRYRLQADLRVRLVRRYATLPPGAAGSLLSTVDSDVELTWQAVRILPGASSALLMLAGGIAAMFATGAAFGWIGLALLLCTLGFGIAYENRAGPRLAHLQEIRGEVAALAQESFEAALLVKVTGREDAETARFAVAADRLGRASVATGRVRAAFDPVMEALPNLGVLATIFVGGLGIVRGAIRPGAVVQVAFLIALVALPLSSIGWLISELPLNAIAYGRAEAVLDCPEDPVGDDPGSPDPGPARVDLVGVAARHPGATEPFPHALTLSVSPGRWVVLAGRSGAGKSTVCALLAGVARCSAGVVRLDGVDLARLAPSARAARMALVLQQPFLFRDTVRANIILGRSIGDDDIWSALRLAQADGFVAALPAGLDTTIGERGHTLSGGQRQRLALARALAARPGLLVLDDATSAVDPRVETAILDGLAALRPGLTVVMASAGLAAVTRADDLVYLHRGVIADRGSHAVLLVRCAGYRELILAAHRDRERQAGHLG